MANRHAEARAYLGIPDTADDLVIRSAIVDAVTADNYGPLPEGVAESPVWARITDDDRDQIARFAAFLRVAGKPVTAPPDGEGSDA